MTTHASAVDLLKAKLNEERVQYTHQQEIIDRSSSQIRRAEEAAKRISKSMTSLEAAIVALGGRIPAELPTYPGSGIQVSEASAYISDGKIPNNVLTANSVNAQRPDISLNNSMFKDGQLCLRDGHGNVIMESVHRGFGFGGGK